MCENEFKQQSRDACHSELQQHKLAKQIHRRDKHFATAQELVRGLQRDAAGPVQHTQSELPADAGAVQANVGRQLQIPQGERQDQTQLGTLRQAVKECQQQATLAAEECQQWRQTRSKNK